MKKILLTSLLIISVLISCGEKKETVKSDLNFNRQYINEAPEIKGGIYKMAYISNSPFKGVFSSVFSSDSVDATLNSYIENYIFYRNEDMLYEDGGMANMTMNLEEESITIKFREGLKWEDGHPLGVDDSIFAYEIIASPEYKGVRFRDSFESIKGLKEYRAGKTNKISGLEKISDTEMKIYFYELGPELLSASNIITTLLPKHYLENEKIETLEQSDKIRLKPLSYGRFKINNIVPGESVEFIPNEYYFREDEIETVDKFIFKIVSSGSVLPSIKIGEYDMFYNIDTQLYNEFKDYDNIEILGRPELYYNYLGFKLGHYDSEKGENVVDPNMKMSDIKLRKAMVHALDVEQVADAFYHGLRMRAIGIIPPAFSEYYDDTLVGYPYNVEKAKQLLDEAGYKDIDGDGIREDKEGKPFVVNFAAMSGGDVAEPMTKFYIQCWEEVGIKVEFTSGRLLDFNNFYDRLESDDKEIDMYIGAWVVGTSLGFETYGKKSQMNYTRYTSKEIDDLFEKTKDKKGLEDPQHRIDAYKAWQKYYIEDVVAEVPLMYRYQIMPVNKRMKEANLFNADKLKTRIKLTSEKTLKASK